MWAAIFVLLPVVAHVGSFVVVPQDEILMNYKQARAQLKPEQKEFLMELLAADDALIESASRGIVDDILQAIAGLGQGQVQVNLLGPGNVPQAQPQPLSPSLVANFQLTSPTPQAQTPAAATSPAPTSSGSSSGQFFLDIAALELSPQQQATLTAMLEKSLDNITASVPASTAAPAMTPPATAAPIPTQITKMYQNTAATSNVTTIGGSNNHLFSTITSVIMNSNRRNVTGIVDQSLRIATPAPIREFVTGILNVVYCNGIRRLLGRC